jgi:PBP1b-binding outer membrane lipoprotein LpoB
MKIILTLITLLTIASCSKTVDPMEEYEEPNYTEQEKVIKTYNLTFEAIHSAPSGTINAGAWYSITITGIDGVEKTDIFEKIVNKKVTLNIEAKSGDEVFIWVSVNSIYCKAILSCYSGSNYMKAVITDNLYIDEYRLFTLN